MKKRSITIDGHRTSISLEDEFWQALKEIAQEQELSIAQVVKILDTSRDYGLSSAIRIFVFNHYRK
jgi:predicted DNA-binding ribbon-helix-helix protein